MSARRAVENRFGPDVEGSAVGCSADLDLYLLVRQNPALWLLPRHASLSHQADVSTCGKISTLPELAELGALQVAVDGSSLIIDFHIGSTSEI